MVLRGCQPIKIQLWALIGHKTHYCHITDWFCVLRLGLHQFRISSIVVGGSHLYDGDYDCDVRCIVYVRRIRFVGHTRGIWVRHVDRLMVLHCTEVRPICI